MTKITIIIPIHNVALYLEKCLGSVVNQTLKEIEIICIDDASTDASSEIIKKYAQNDKRIKVITYKENKTASQARKDGVNLASGKYTMFLDGDDWFELNACEVLYGVMEQEKVDMVHFGTNVINDNATVTKVLRKQEFLKPYEGKLEGKEVFDSCFINESYRFNIWNKIYKTELCKKAFGYMKDGCYPKAQDLYAYFLVAYFAESYIGRGDLVFYNYNFGSGVTGRNSLSIEHFKRYCTQAAIAEELKAFLNKVDAYAEYKEAHKKIFESLLQETLWYWNETLESAYTAEGFSMVAKEYETKGLVCFMANRYNKKKAEIAAKLEGASFLQCEIGEIKTILYICSKDTATKDALTLNQTIALYKKLGYRIIIMTERELNQEVKVSPDITIVNVPDSKRLKYKKYSKRLCCIEKVIQENRVDMVVYADGANKFLLFDLLYIKLNQIPLIVYDQELLEKEFIKETDSMYDNLFIYRLADYVAVGGAGEQRLFEKFGLHTEVVKQPFEVKTSHSGKEQRNIILWTGYMDEEETKYQEAVILFSEIAKAAPELEFVMFNTVAGNEEEATAYIVDHGLAGNVKIISKLEQLEALYGKVLFHVNLSPVMLHENYLANSLAHSVPIVMYGTVNASETAANPGCITLRYNDRNSIMNTILDFRNKKEEYKLLVDSIPSESKAEMTTWEHLLSDVSRYSRLQKKKSRLEEDAYLLSILKMHSLGIERNKENEKQLKEDFEEEKQSMLDSSEQQVITAQQKAKKSEQQKQKAEKKLEELKSEYQEHIQKYQKLNVKYRRLRGKYDKVRSSAFYRFGCIIMKIPRKIKSIVRKR